jgi:hypothetical protein
MKKLFFLDSLRRTNLIMIIIIKSRLTLIFVFFVLITLSNSRALGSLRGRRRPTFLKIIPT